MLRGFLQGFSRRVWLSMRKLLIFLVFLLVLVPVGVFAYDTPQELLRVEKAPPLDSNLVNKFRLDPKQSSTEKASMLALWGGAAKYGIVVKLPVEERLVYLVYKSGIVDESLIETEVSSTETFGGKVESISSGLKVQTPGLREVQPTLSSVSTIMNSLRSKGLVK